jgi:hypothetical protein
VGSQPTQPHIHPSSSLPSAAPSGTAKSGSPSQESGRDNRREIFGEGPIPKLRHTARQNHHFGGKKATKQMVTPKKEQPELQTQNSAAETITKKTTYFFLS